MQPHACRVVTRVMVWRAHTRTLLFALVPVHHCLVPAQVLCILRRELQRLGADVADGVGALRGQDAREVRVGRNQGGGAKMYGVIKCNTRYDVLVRRIKG